MLFISELLPSTFSIGSNQQLASVLICSCYLCGTAKAAKQVAVSCKGDHLLQVIFGFGVGGEYPIASSSASERAEADSKLQSRRGETVILVFAMQVCSLHIPTSQKD